MPITLKPVDSSQIHAIGHDPDTNTLAVQFLRKGEPGDVYHYDNFTADQHQALISAESIGSHFGAHVKGAKDDQGNLLHPFTKLGASSA